MIRFIDEYRNRFSVEFICTTLKNNRVGGFITSRGYRQSKARGPSARRLRDAVLVERISTVHRDNYSVYGVRKMWHALRREGIDIGREHTARLMRLAGVSGKNKGRSPVTTRRSKTVDTRPDLVGREFTASGPNKLWVADITYVRTNNGFVYAAFVTDVYSRRIAGWALSDSMRTEVLPLQALNQAIVCAEETTGLIHHSDHGSQGGFNWLSQHPEHGGMRRWLPRTGVRRPVICRWGCGVSGVRIGRCGLRCVPRVGRFRHGQCNASSGV